MEQNSGSQNQNQGFFQENMVPIIVVVLIAVLAIIYFVSRGSDTADDRNDQQTQQTGGENQNQSNQNQNGTEPTPAPTSTEGQTGNVTAQGTLRASDNPALGNLVVESDQGKIYISTGRDFSSLVGQRVTLNAQGTLNSFTFLGFNGSTVTAPSTDGVSTERNVAFSGTLQTSNSSKGNYTITSGDTVVHLQSAHDYSAWVGSTVQLSASGTLNSFNNAVLVKR